MKKVIVVLSVVFGVMILGIIALQSMKVSSKPEVSQIQTTQQGTLNNQNPTPKTQPVVVTPTPPQTPTATTYLIADIAKHASESSCWMAIDGSVYDVTSFIPNHPGGRQMLLGCGKDASAMFNGRHSTQARSLLPNYLIGKLSI